jgi:hypothetical protein
MLALIMILLFKPVQTLILSYLGIDIPLAFPHPVSLSIWLIAVGLIIALWRSGCRPVPIQIAHGDGSARGGLSVL